MALMWENSEVIIKNMWSLIFTLECPSGGTKFSPYLYCQTHQKRSAKGPSIPCMSLADPLRLGQTPSPVNLATCLAALAHSYRKRISSLRLCRPVHFTIPLAPSNQKGHGGNYLGPQLCAEAAWVKSA